MTDVLSVQHPPALRVGGRRLSISARPKPHLTAGTTSPAHLRSPTATDYPRPAAAAQSAEGAAADPPLPPPPHTEEEPPKKEKKPHGGHDQHRLRESVYRKLETTVPSKDHLHARHAFGAGGRIGQPMGRALSV